MEKENVKENLLALTAEMQERTPKEKTPMKVATPRKLGTKTTVTALLKANDGTSEELLQSAPTPVSSSTATTSLAKNVRISDSDVVQVLMQGSGPRTLPPRTPAKVVGEPSENGTLLVRTAEGGVYRVRKNTIEINSSTGVSVTQSEKLAKKELIFDDISDALTTRVVDHAGDDQVSRRDEPGAVYDVVPSPPCTCPEKHVDFYAAMSVSELRDSLGKTFEVLMAAIEIEEYEELQRIMDDAALKQQAMDHLGFPAPAKISSHVTMTRAQFQTAIDENNFEKCGVYQSRLEELMEHEAWLRHSTSKVDVVIACQSKLKHALAISIEEKKWSKCSELKRNIVLVDCAVNMLKMESCDNEIDIENHIAKLESEIGVAMTAGNYSACALLNEKLATLHSARDQVAKKKVGSSLHTPLPAQTEADDISASIYGMEEELRRTEMKTNSLRAGTGTIMDVSRLSPENLKAHDDRYERSKACMIDEDARSFFSDFTSVSRHEHAFAFKVTDKQGNTYRFRSAIMEYEAILRKSAQRLQIDESRLTLKYEDEEGDLIVLRDSDDIKEAIEMARRCAKNFVKLSYSEKPRLTPLPVPHIELNSSSGEEVEADDQSSESSSDASPAHKVLIQRIRKIKKRGDSAQSSFSRNRNHDPSLDSRRKGRRRSFSECSSASSRSSSSVENSATSSCSDSHSVSSNFSIIEKPPRNIHPRAEESLFTSFFSNSVLEKYSLGTDKPGGDDGGITTSMAVAIAASVAVVGLLLLSGRN